MLKEEFSLNEVINIAKEEAIDHFAQTISLYGYEEEFFEHYNFKIEVKEEK
tara:strand:+ start:427 stop:579 length:153 start_codon:yes stop_codon:yes gene_type:complete